MRLACAEGNGARLAGRTSQSTARIARTAGNLAICRTFLRSILSMFTDRQVPLPTATTNTARLSTA
jgi:hypothetical protein